MLRCGKVLADRTDSQNKPKKPHKAEVSQSHVILKSDDHVWLVGHPLELITTASLPTRRQAYLRFRQIQQTDGNPTAAWLRYRAEDPRFQKLSYVQIVATKVIDEVAYFWRRGCYTIKRSFECRNELLKIHDEWSHLVRSKNEYNVGEKRQASRDNFVHSLDKILDLNPKNWQEIIRKSRTKDAADTDIEYMNMLLDGKPTGGMGGKDNNHRCMIERKEKRLDDELRRKQTEMNRLEQIQIDTASMNEHDVDSPQEHDINADPNFQPPLKKTKKDDYITLRLPRTFTRNPNLTSAADRTKTSNNQLAIITGSLLSLAGVNASDVVLSPATIRRHRKINRSTEASKIKEGFIRSGADSKAFIALHWDEKMLPTVTGEKMEHLAVVASGGPHEDGKLLAAVSIKDGCGKTMSDKIKAITADWCILEHIQAIVFDTTSSNTGCFTGAATRLEIEYDRKLVWCACRHHISELCLGAAWEALFGSTQSKDNTYFKEFAAYWPTITRENPRLLTITDPRLVAEKEDTIDILRNANKSTRDDYNEAVELGLLMLGDVPPQSFKWRNPGAFSHARWMAHMLYAPKMLAFSQACGYDHDS